MFLDETREVRPIAICRTARAGALLVRYGIETRVGRVDDARSTATLLDGCDLIADFSLPRGRLADIRRATEGIVEGAIRGSPPRAPFVYISSYMALGMQGENAVARYHLVPRSTYAAAKRHGERTALQLGRQAGKAVYVLRLGQVFGELQTASRVLSAQVSEAPVLIPDCLSYSVFAYSVAEALAGIAAGREHPGKYSVVSTPEWSWHEVYAYHCARRGVRADVTLAAVSVPDARGTLKRAALAPATAAATAVLSLANSHRDTLAANLLWRTSSLEARILADYRTRRARAEIHTMQSESLWKPFQIFVGKVRGGRLTSLSDSRITMEPAARRVREKLAELTEIHDQR